MDCSPPGSSVHGDLPGKNTGVGGHFLLQGIFPTQGWNLGFPHCRRILYSSTELRGKLQQSLSYVLPVSLDVLILKHLTPVKSHRRGSLGALSQQHHVFTVHPHWSACHCLLTRYA